MGNDSRLLTNKTAVVFAATGTIAGRVAARFAEEGAAVFVSGRDETRLQQLVHETEAADGRAIAQGVDATRESGHLVFVT